MELTSYECNQLEEGANQLEKEGDQLQEGAREGVRPVRGEGANQLEKEWNQLQEGADQVQQEG